MFSRFQDNKLTIFDDLRRKIGKKLPLIPLSKMITKVCMRCPTGGQRLLAAGAAKKHTVVHSSECDALPYSNESICFSA